MIIVNGHIRPILKSGGGLDEDGDPVKADERLGCPIPCQWKKAGWDNLARVDETHYIQKSFIILIEKEDRFDSEELCLYAKGKDMGRYSILSMEDLDAVCQTKITI